MIDVSRVVNNPILQTSFTLERDLYDAMGEGEWTKVATETYQYTGGIRPAKADEMLVLPEAERALKTIAVFSVDPILLSDGNGQQSDVIVYNSERYRVQWVWQYTSYFKAIATRFLPHAN